MINIACDGNMEVSGSIIDPGDIKLNATGKLFSLISSNLISKKLGMNINER